MKINYKSYFECEDLELVQFPNRQFVSINESATTHFNHAFRKYERRYDVVGEFDVAIFNFIKEYLKPYEYEIENNRVNFELTGYHPGTVDDIIGTLISATNNYYESENERSA